MDSPELKTSDIHVETVIGQVSDVGRLAEENKKLERAARNSSRLAIALGVLLLLALGALVGVLIHYNLKDSDKEEPLATCGTDAPGYGGIPNDLSEPDSPGVFHDLTLREIQGVRAYLEAEIGLVKPDEAQLRDAHIYTMELELPKKTDVLSHLDAGGAQPERQARVVVFRGDLAVPVVQELVCGPLSKISQCRVDLTVPFAHRPIEYREYEIYSEYVIPDVHSRFGHILRESYGASFDYENCEDDCFNFWPVPVGNNAYGLPDVRKVWLVAMYYRIYYSLFPVDFALLINVDGVDPALFQIEKVWYSGQMFDDLDDFVVQYNTSSINKTQIPYPPDRRTDGIGGLKPHGTLKPQTPQRPPELVEPDGKRYTINHRKIEYLDMWSFDYRISSLYGPAIHDVRFQGERIAYEISLMELLAVYSGDNPATRLTVFVDTATLTGSRSKALVSGADCPTTATFLSKTVTSQGREEPATFSRAACVFEQNFGRPLRRHHSYSLDDGAFYGGMLDSALVVRSIHTVDNYDYVVEFKFHQTGALGVTVFNTGYIMTSFYATAERPYGVKVDDVITGPIHMHVAHFKVDLDISGTSNRYETMDIYEQEVDLRQTNPPRKLSQMRYNSTVKQRETEAAYVYNFDQPMYHIFHNDAVRNVQGEKKSYRLDNKAVGKMLLQQDAGNEFGFTWTRYQVAVTQRKDEERVSSTPYAQWGSANPQVKFQDWIDDDESILDEDIVAWVTLGVHHIPHSEDLPVTPTAGAEQSFYLHPYNYFPVCPSVSSRDAVYMEHLDEDDVDKGLSYVYPGDEKNGGSSSSCAYIATNISQPWADQPEMMFETSEHNGVL